MIGAVLDSEPRQSYDLLITQQTIVVEGSAGYYRVCTPAGLAPLLQEHASHRLAVQVGLDDCLWDAILSPSEADLAAPLSSVFRS